MCFIPNCFINLLSKQLICGNQFAHKFAHFWIYKVDFFWAHRVVLTIVINSGIMPPQKKNAKLSLLRDQHFGLVDLVGRTASLGLFVAMLAGNGIMLAARVWTLPNLSFLNESDAPYTCNDWFAIEIGNSPYNYLWALTRLRQVNIIT